MTYTATVKSAAEQAAQAADKTLFVTRNALLDLESDPVWLAGATDVTSTLYPTTLACDGQADAPTRPEYLAATTTVDLVFELTPSVRGQANQVKAVAVLGHNLYTVARALGATLTVNAEIANAGDFVSGYARIGQWSITAGYDDPPLVSLDLAGAFGEYASVPWFRLRVSSSVAFTSSALPAVGEIFLGRTRQLGRRPDRPFDARSATSSVSRARSKTGSLASYELFADAGDIRMTLTAYDGTDRDTSLDDVSTLEAWWTDTRGVDPFLFFDEPGTNPSHARFVALDPPGRKFNFYDLQLGEIEIGLIEIPPFLGPVIT